MKSISKESDSNICTSVFCVSETWFGIEKLIESHKKDKLTIFFEQFFQEILILDYDYKAAIIFSKQKAELQKIGKSIEDFDLLIASTAIAHDCTLVTRNLKHFQNIDNLITATW